MTYHYRRRESREAPAMDAEKATAVTEVETTVEMSTEADAEPDEAQSEETQTDEGSLPAAQPMRRTTRKR